LRLLELRRVVRLGGGGSGSGSFGHLPLLRWSGTG
jgi:hypothetical protein